MPRCLTKLEVAWAIDQGLTEALVSCLASGEPADMRNTDRIDFKQIVTKN
jgi:hypothetical protein